MHTQLMVLAVKLGSSRSSMPVKADQTFTYECVCVGIGVCRSV